LALHVALTGTELTNLAGAHTSRWYLSVVNNTTTATAQINMPGGITWPVAELTVDGASGNWTSIGAGMTVAIGSAAGLSDYGLYRARSTPLNTTTLDIGETAEGDIGLITQSIRTASFGDNAYVTAALYRRDVWSVIPRIIAASGTIFEDFNAVVDANNYAPGPIVNISLVDASGGVERAGMVDSGQVYRTVVFTATPGHWAGATTPVYAWVAPAGWGAPTAGATNAASVTYRVPASTQNYEISCTITDSNAVPRTGYRQIWAHDRSSNAPITVTSIDGLSWDRTGAKATITLNDNGLASVTKGAMVCLWGECLFSGAVITSVNSIVGWVVEQEEISEPGLRSATLTIEGPAGMLAKLGEYSHYFQQVSGTPSTWQELLSGLCYIDYILYLMVTLRCPAINQLFNWTPLGISNLSGRMPQWKISTGGSLLSQLQAYAKTWNNANFGFNPDGHAMVRVHPSLYAYASRGTIPTRATLTQSKMLRFTPRRVNKPGCRSVRGEAFTWDGSSALPTPLLSDAPGSAPGQGTRYERAQGMIVDSQSHINQVTGDWYIWENNPLPEILVELMGNWSVFYPAEMQFVALTLPAAYRPDGAALSMNAIPSAVSLRFNEDHTIDTSLSVEGETTGVAGVTVPVPVGVVSGATYSSAPSVRTTSSSIFSPTFSGGTVIAMDVGSSQIFLTTSWLSGTPTWVNITGTGLAGSAFEIRLDPFSPLLQSAHTGTLGAWCVTVGASGGLFYCSNLLVASPVWVRKQSHSAHYAHIRPSHAAQGVIYLGRNGTSGGGTGPTYVAKYSSYGSTLDWGFSITGDSSTLHGMDIDPFGDSVLISAASGANNYVYRVSGGAATQLAGTSTSGSAITYIQRPLTAFGSGANVSGSGECFVWADETSRKMWTTSNGGSSKTEIQPAANFRVDTGMNSIMSVQDANVIIGPDTNTGHLWTSTNAGGAWIDRGAVISSVHVYTAGYFPRLIAGSYALYLGTELGAAFSPDYATITDKTGNLASVGATGGIAQLIPLY
jgi:hypothetical protein